MSPALCECVTRLEEKTKHDFLTCHLNKKEKLNCIPKEQRMIYLNVIDEQMNIDYLHCCRLHDDDQYS